MRPARRGNLLWITLGVLFLAALSVAVLSRQALRGSRGTASLRQTAEARWAAHTALASFANHLKMRPWAERFYADPKYRPDGKPDYALDLSTPERDVHLWARDSVRAGQVQTGTTDVFVTARAGGGTCSLYQRLLITPAPATNPRALRVLRELSLVKEDLASADSREHLLEVVAGDERDAAAHAALAAVCSRGMDAAGGQDLEPARAVELVRAQAAEEPGEKAFADLMRQGRTALDRVDYAGAAALFDRAAGAAGSSPLHRPQRWMAAQLAAARASYAQALATPEPQRAALANDVVQRLDGIVREMGEECAGPSAEYLKAQIQVLTARRPPAAATAAGGSPDRDRVVVDVSTELEQILSRIGRGRTFEGGSVPLVELPPQFRQANLMSLAYTDSFLEQRQFNFWFFSIPLLWPVSQRLSLTDRDGQEVRTLISSGQFDPDGWLAGGQALIATDHGGDSGYDVVVMDRTGKIIAGFRGVKPVATAESGGVWVTPAGDGLVLFGVGPGNVQGYWVQDLKTASPPRRVGPSFGPDVLVDHDPLAFSPDGASIAFVDPSGTVNLAPTAGFLAGSSTGQVALRFTPDSPYLHAPAFAWVGKAGRLFNNLVAFTNQDDKGNPNAGKLVFVTSLMGFTFSNGLALPHGFVPGLIVPERTRDDFVLLDKDNAHYVRVALSDTALAQPETLPAASYQTRPGRGADDVIYLAGKVSDTEPGIWRWDLSSGKPPERLPLPPEVGPTRLHIITTPVSY